MKTITWLSLNQIRHIYSNLDGKLRQIGLTDVATQVTASLAEIELMGEAILEHARRLKSEVLADDDLLILRNTAWQSAHDALAAMDAAKNDSAAVDRVVAHLMRFEFCVGRMTDRLRTKVPPPRTKSTTIRKIDQFIAALPAGANLKAAVFDAREQLGLKSCATMRTVENYISKAKKRKRST